MAWLRHGHCKELQFGLEKVVIGEPNSVPSGRGFHGSHIILMANLNLVESRGHIMAMNINIRIPVDPKKADDFKA
jgi:hypothetical protein